MLQGRRILLIIAGGIAAYKSLELIRLLRSLDRMIADWSQGGVVLHAESLAAQAAHRARLPPFLVVPLWIAAAALVAIAIVLVIEH